VRLGVYLGDEDAEMRVEEILAEALAAARSSIPWRKAAPW
jgi:hypothetical protein